jgi:hypothetical protein
MPYARDADDREEKSDATRFREHNSFNRPTSALRRGHLRASSAARPLLGGDLEGPRHRRYERVRV